MKFDIEQFVSFADGHFVLRIPCSFLHRLVKMLGKGSFT